LFIFLTLTRLVVVFIFVNFSFALFTPPPLGDYHKYVNQTTPKWILYMLHLSQQFSSLVQTKISIVCKNLA
jgi:hypothetical protein